MTNCVYIPPLKPLLSSEHKGFATLVISDCSWLHNYTSPSILMSTLVATSPLGRNLRSDGELPQMLASVGQRSRIERRGAMLIFDCCALSYLHPPLTLRSCAGRPLPARNAYYLLKHIYKISSSRLN